MSAARRRPARPRRRWKTAQALDSEISLAHSRARSSPTQHPAHLPAVASDHCCRGRTLLVSAHTGCAVRRVAITAAERNEVYCVASFRTVPRRQKPAFGVAALWRLVHLSGELGGAAGARSVTRASALGVCSPAQVRRSASAFGLRRRRPTRRLSSPKRNSAVIGNRGRRPEDAASLEIGDRAGFSPTTSSIV